jgi:hypothetical protein
MPLPNVECAFVEETKINAYLLNVDHAQGASKAKFFRAHGARPEQWTLFRSVLLAHARNNSVNGLRTSPRGIKLYQVDCQVEMPDGSRPCIRTVWEVRADQPCPRLITAHPNSQ